MCILSSDDTFKYKHKREDTFCKRINCNISKPYIQGSNPGFSNMFADRQLMLIPLGFEDANGQVVNCDTVCEYHN